VAEPRSFAYFHHSSLQRSSSQDSTSTAVFSVWRQIHCSLWLILLRPSGIRCRHVLVTLFFFVAALRS